MRVYAKCHRIEELGRTQRKQTNRDRRLRRYRIDLLCSFLRSVTNAQAVRFRIFQFKTQNKHTAVKRNVPRKRLQLVRPKRWTQTLEADWLRPSRKTLFGRRRVFKCGRDPWNAIGRDQRIRRRSTSVIGQPLSLVTNRFFLNRRRFLTILLRATDRFFFSITGHCSGLRSSFGIFWLRPLVLPGFTGFYRVLPGARLEALMG